MKRNLFFIGPLVVLITGVISCASVQELLETGVQKPKVEFVGMKLTGLSFSDLDLLFDLKVTNPNVVGITLAGFDYDFLINGRSFVNGNQDKGMTIASRGESTVQIPVSLQFADIYQTVTHLGNQDSTTFQINTGFSFELPVLGVQRVPVSHSGSIPLLKLPSVSIGSLRLKSLKFTGADLQLDLKINNPNAFAFNLDAINYKLDINQSQWVSGNSERTSRIGAKSDGNLTIPISLNFLQIGRSAYQLLNGNQPLQYHLKGDIDIGTSIPLLGKVSLPIDRAGEIRITR